MIWKCKKCGKMHWDIENCLVVQAERKKEIELERAKLDAMLKNIQKDIMKYNSIKPTELDPELVKQYKETNSPNFSDLSFPGTVGTSDSLILPCEDSVRTKWKN